MLLAWVAAASAGDDVRFHAAATTMQRLREAAESSPVSFGPFTVGDRKDVELRVWGCATRCRAVVMSGGTTMFPGIEARKASDGTWEVLVEDPALKSRLVLHGIPER